MKRLRVGHRYRITWIDFANFTNVELAEVKPPRCWTEGKLAIQTDKFIALTTSQYLDERGNETGEGDYTLLIVGGIEEIKKL